MKAQYLIVALHDFKSAWRSSYVGAMCVYLSAYCFLVLSLRWLVL